MDGIGGSYPLDCYDYKSTCVAKKNDDSNMDSIDEKILIGGDCKLC